MDTTQFEREIRKDEEIIKKEERDIGTLENKIEVLDRSISDKEKALRDAEADLAKTKESLNAIIKKTNDLKQNSLPKDIEERKRLFEEKENKKALVVKIQKELEDARRQAEEAVKRQKND